MAVVGLSASFFLEARLQQWLVSSLETRLKDQTRASQMVILNAHPKQHDAYQAITRQLGQALTSQITLFDEDGRLLGDSAHTTTQSSTPENMASSPEVQLALENSQSTMQRFVPQTNEEMLFVSQRFRMGGSTYVIRAGLPFSTIHGAIAQLRYLMVLASLLGLAIAIIMSGLASHFFSRALTELMLSARAISRGQGHRRISTFGSGELGSIARSINRMSEEIENLVKSLTDDREQFESVLEGMREGVIAVNASRQVTLVNASARELLALPKDVKGRPLIDLIRVPALMDLIARAEEDETTETEFSIPGPRQKIFLAHMTRRSNNDGLIIVLHDVTRLRLLETMRRDFVANVSHELRTPVSIIKGNADNLLDGAIHEPKLAQQFVETIMRNSDRIGRLIADLLDLSKLEAGVFKLDLGPTNAADISQRCLDALSSKLTEDRVDVANELTEPLTVVADPNALEQILTNLIDNAVKYSSSPARIRIWSASDDGKCRIFVEDNGPGIEAHHRPRLFERFYRVDNGRSREKGGTGLGLAIVKHLAHSMHGSVGMEPAPNQGSVFWVELPEPSP